MSMEKLLFISWDGPQVSYLEGLFLPILTGLRKDYEVHVLQFTWGDKNKSEEIREACCQQGVIYTRYEIRRKPWVMPGTLWTLIAGIRFIRRYVKRSAIGVTIYRGIFPSFMASRALKNMPWIKRIMDADGLPLEERVDFDGMDPEGFRYKYLKQSEARAIRMADIVLVRSRATIDILAPEVRLARKFHVVLNGRDSALFSPPLPEERKRVRKELGFAAAAFVLVYAGSMGQQYCMGEMLRLWEILVERGMDARFLVLTGTPEIALAWNVADRMRNRMTVKSIPFHLVPRYLGVADAGLAIRQPSLSMKGVSPVKLGEYLLCGLPVVASSGIGDTEQLLRGRAACCLLDDHSEASLQNAASWLQQSAVNPRVAGEARRAGIEDFGLAECILSYERALKHLL
jgi:glycosyltransferase involved in cell wall biosynthesis